VQQPAKKKKKSLLLGANVVRAGGLQHIRQRHRLGPRYRRRQRAALLHFSERPAGFHAPMLMDI
jgi:hypothetical protein